MDLMIFPTTSLFPLLILVATTISARLGAIDCGFGLQASIPRMGCRDVEGNGKRKGSGFYVGDPNQSTMDLNQLNAM